MKKLILLAIAFIAFQTSFAQKFTKGDIFVEGTVKFVTSDAEKTFNFNPSVGYFLSDKFAVGGELNTQTTKESGIKNTESFGVGVFARCFFLEVGKLQVYSQLGVSINDNKLYTETYQTIVDNEIVTNTRTVNGNKSTQAALSLGANYFITNKLSLTMKAADLASYKSVNGGDDRLTAGFEGVNNPFSLASLGLNYRF